MKVAALSLLSPAVTNAQGPAQPHLSQAWTAMSIGDGLDGQVGKESYHVSSDKKFKAHKFEYPDCTKISLHDSSQLHHIKGGERNYYIGCYAVNCCYTDFHMKEWDIQGPSMYTTTEFIGYEDTTELNGKTVTGAEHWQEKSKFMGVGVDYDYFIHRTDDGDVISHRIDFNVSGTDVPAGSILYGDFEVQHDLDTFKQTFTPPDECLKPNVLKCPSDKVASSTAEDPERPHLAQAWTAMSKGDGLPNQVGQESYVFDDDRKIRGHWYKYDGCQKLSIKDHAQKVESNYYLGCDAVNCCYGDFSMKQWDIGMGKTSQVTFVGFEDTTELNDAPVSQAEHWHEEIPLPFTSYKIQYDHFVTRSDGDIITHRINFNATGGIVPPGEILYSDFQVQHDIDAFIQSEFQIPAQCKRNNLLRCDDSKVGRWEETYFKHSNALETRDVSV
jgi:hypothetical protein